MSDRSNGGRVVAIAELADELGCYKSTLFRICRRLNVEPRKMRDAHRGNQLVSVIDGDDATRIRTAYLESTRTRDLASGDGEVLCPEDGVFYLIQLEPECDPGRFKVGFTTDLEGRLRHHRCAAPFAELVKSWPCRRTWERAAIDCLTDGIEQVHTEVFRTESLSDVQDRGGKFFSMMPRVRVISEANDGDAA